MSRQSLSVWRDYDNAALQLGEFMRLDSVELAPDAGLLAENVFTSGGRLVVVDEIVDFDALAPADATRFIAVLRELTSYGISVRWRLRTSRGDMRWRDLWHLLPPSEVDAPPGAATQDLEFWQQNYYYGLCFMRHGPGIVEVRDRREGRMRCLRFTSALHLETIERLERGAQAASCAPEVLAEFEAARVVLAVGSMRLWLPCRFRRSALSPIGYW